MSTVQPIGSIFETDDRGYIVNPASADKIQAKWLPVIEEVKDLYLKHFGTNLHSVYLRGSVAKGKAIEGISDIDSFAVVNLKFDEVDMSWREEAQQELREKYSFISGVEIGAVPLEEVSGSKGDQIMIKTQSICLHGDDLALTIPPFKADASLAQHIQGIGREVGQTREWLSEDRNEDQILRKCSWIMKRLVRSGLELTLDKSGKYSRDLYPCYQILSEYYPEKKDEMCRALELAVEPTTDKAIVVELLDSLGDWIASEAETVLKK